MMNFKINTERCTECGACAKECPVMIIDGKQGIPVIKEGKEKNCIKCQHCLAVCPTAALSIWDKDPDNSMAVGNNPTPEDMQRMIKTRRSIRRFKDETLSDDILNDLLDTAAHAPSGHNKNQVLLSLTRTTEQRDQLRTLIYDTIKAKKEAGELGPEFAMFANFQKVWESKGIDVLFRNAPHFIIATAPADNRNAKPDGIISLSYMELYANSLGLGTLWNGLIKIVLENIAPELVTKMGIPEDHTIGYMLIFGKTPAKYKRSIQSDALHINEIKL